ncbi:hypothetical protein [Limosilactobacillus equigenerosi]|nr:hypothetical protein [Limosilactobacillus equigenerosi]
MLTAIIGVKLIYRRETRGIERRPVMRILTILLIILGGIPSAITTKQVVQATVAQRNIQALIDDKIKHGTIIAQSVDLKAKQIRLSVAQVNLNQDQIQQIMAARRQYHLQAYDLEIIQVADLNELTSRDYNRYLNNLINDNRKDYQAQQELNVTKKLAKIRRIAKTELDDRLVKISVQSNYDVLGKGSVRQSYDVEIVVNSPVSDDDQAQLTTKIKQTLPQVDQVKFVPDNQSVN